jgi:hypothetical protein
MNILADTFNNGNLSTPFFWIALGGVILISYLMGKRRESRFQELAAGLNAQVTRNGWNSIETLMGNFNGKDFTFEYSPETNYRPARIKIEISNKGALSFSASADFSIRKETLLDKMGKNLGVWHEVETGNEEFDQKYFISAQNENAAASYLLAPAHRTKINNLFGEYSVHQIDFNQSSVSAIFEYTNSFRLAKNILNDFTPELVKNILTELAGLTESSS